MKFVKKIPDADKKLSDKLISEGWEKIREPKNLFVTILISIPLMFINAVISILIINQFSNWWKNVANMWTSIVDNSSFNITISTSSIVFFVAAVFILLIVHEWLHMIFIPNFIKSDKTCWGITLNGGFVATTEKIVKNRFIIISAVPFILLSVVLPIILGICGLLNNFIVFIIIINAAASSVDVINIILISVQVPRNSYIINNGFETYFK